MVWGGKTPKVEAKPSTLSQVLPLLILLVFLAGAAVVGYHIYVSATKIRQNASQSMAKKNVVFTKDGMRVGVKHVENERYVDATQSWFVKAWNMSSSGKADAAKKK
ncbi:Uu.00g135990.m01.CDS01 [Anthostomella pinea]|uniref:Uu.00g135990.m01.CDS01 n=1 Tax=Anthostomella pinea TaxID=933095 RepID=A0AAI8VPW2_9PEZI|nr:Uu.00g135990.m01.CDS01 [Anthostomella pinea]